MKTRVFIWCLFVSLSFNLLGCATVQSKPQVQAPKKTVEEIATEVNEREKNKPFFYKFVDWWVHNEALK